jgi:hypothetical protein
MGRSSSPTFWWSVPHFSLCWMPSPLHWGRWHHTRLLQLPCLFIVGVRECPSPELRESCPLCYVSFFFSCLFIIQVFFLFSLDRGQSFQGAMLICPMEYRMPLICSPGCLPSRVGAGIWQDGSTPGFSI